MSSFRSSLWSALPVTVICGVVIGVFGSFLASSNRVRAARARPRAEVSRVPVAFRESPEHWDALVATYTRPEILDYVVPAIHAVESGSRTTVEGIGPAGEVGPLQITQAVVTDVNEWINTSYTLDDMHNLDYAKHVCIWYLRRWGAAYRARTGLAPTPEVYARIWNGGPYGYDKPSTLDYGRRVANLVTAQKGQK